MKKLRRIRRKIEDLHTEIAEEYRTLREISDDIERLQQLINDKLADVDALDIKKELDELENELTQAQKAYAEYENELEAIDVDVTKLLEEIEKETQNEKRGDEQ